MADMKKSRYSEEQIIGFLKQAEAGVPIKELCRKGGFSDATFYKWRARFGGMEVADAKRLRELEQENAKLKRLLAEAHLDMHALKSVLGVKVWPHGKGEAIGKMNYLRRSGSSSKCAAPNICGPQADPSSGNPLHRDTPQWRPKAIRSLSIADSLGVRSVAPAANMVFMISLLQGLVPSWTKPTCTCVRTR